MFVAEILKKNLRRPDSTIRFPRALADVVELGEITVGREVDEPGWRWSEHVRPLVGTEWCQAHHVGFVISGRWAATLPGGPEVEFGPDDVFDVPPGHDAWTLGDEPAVSIEWTGMHTWSASAGGLHDRVLATLLFTDIVASTAHLNRVGDRAWRDLLTEHYEVARETIARFRGREIDRSGDGILAIFEGPALALACAGRLREIANAQGLHMRMGVHVGEVEHVGTGIRGLAVHEGARIMAAADDDEILVCETTRALASSAGLAFEDRGLYELKGLPGQRRLFALTAEGVAESGPGASG